MTDAERQELRTLRLNPGLGSRTRRAYLEALDRIDHARTEVLRTEQWAHLGAGYLAVWRAAREVLARAEADLEEATAAEGARQREATERARVAAAIVPPDPGDWQVRDRLARLARTRAPEVWEADLRSSGDPVDLRAVRHLGWLRRQHFGGSQV